MVNFTREKWLKIIISILFLSVIILGSVLLARIQNDTASRLPYTIGSPIIPATEMPAGMIMKTFTVPSNEPTPTLALTITKDTMNGWDVNVTTTNFTFAPGHLNGAPVAGEGHVHLYIDNNLIIMLGPWYHIDSMTQGMHTIRVGLFNNDHSAYSVNGVHIEAQTEVNVGASGLNSGTTMVGM